MRGGDLKKSCHLRAGIFIKIVFWKKVAVSNFLGVAVSEPRPAAPHSGGYPHQTYNAPPTMVPPIISK